jgi:hypothetical protein
LWPGRAGVNSTRVARFPETVRGGYLLPLRVTKQPINSPFDICDVSVKGATDTILKYSFFLAALVIINCPAEASTFPKRQHSSEQVKVY